MNFFIRPFGSKEQEAVPKQIRFMPDLATTIKNGINFNTQHHIYLNTHFLRFLEQEENMTQDNNIIYILQFT